MSTAKATGIKVPSKATKPPATTAPKTNPSTGKNLSMYCFFGIDELVAMCALFALNVLQPDVGWLLLVVLWPA